MGKGYNNYMCKKFFHPTNFDNIKRKWMAEQENDFDKKKEEEKLDQYRREQEMLENRVLLGDTKAKLGLAWMYDQPALLDNEPPPEVQEAKFEWQRKYNAPRETYCKNSSEITDQPFGIEVRNVRCMRCKQWGHMNTDRLCPMFGKSYTQEPTVTEELPLGYAKKGLRSEGLQFAPTTSVTTFNSILYKAKEGVKKVEENTDDVEQDLTVQFLKNLSERQREKLLKKLTKLSKKETDGGSKTPSEKHQKSKKHSHKGRH